MSIFTTTHGAPELRRIAEGIGGLRPIARINNRRFEALEDGPPYLLAIVRTFWQPEPRVSHRRRDPLVREVLANRGSSLVVRFKERGVSQGDLQVVDGKA